MSDETAYAFTETDRALAALAASEERFRLAAEAMSGYVYDYDMLTRRVERTDGFEQVTGYSSEEAQPPTEWWLSHIHPDDREATLARSTAAHADPTCQLVTLEYRYRHKDGRWIAIVDRQRLVRDADGRCRRIIGGASDVTAQRDAENDRRFLLELGMSLQEHDDPGVLLMDATARIGRHLGLARCTFGEVDEAGDSLTMIAGYHADGVPETYGRHSLRDAFGTAIETLWSRQPLVVDDAATDARTAGHYDARLAASLARSFVTTPLIRHGSWAAILAATDVAPRVWTRREVACLHAAALRVWPAYEATRLLAAEQSARVRAEAANQAKTDFLATMSHELRTPLNAIQGHAQLLEMGVYGPLTDAQRDALARIDRSQRSLLGLINNVLNLARIEAGQVFYTLEDFAFHELVADISTLVDGQFTSKGLRYEVHLPAAPVMVRADRQKVEQILLNVLSNAIKFTPSGGCVRLELGERADGSGDPSSHVYIRIVDTGRGIPRDKLETIFEPFVQVDARRTRTTDGVGLGLAISRDLARGMGGDLRARSTEGVESVFTLSLPRAHVSRTETSGGS